MLEGCYRKVIFFSLAVRLQIEMHHYVFRVRCSLLMAEKAHQRFF